MYVLLTWPGLGRCLHANMTAVNAINIMQTCVGRQHGEYTELQMQIQPAAFVSACQEIWEIKSIHAPTPTLENPGQSFANVMNDEVLGTR